MERERDLERYLRRKVEVAGGLALKFTSPGNDGVPDRLVILPGGKTIFVELKAPRGRLSSLQRWQQSRLTRRGCEVRTVWTREQVDSILREQEGGKEG